MCKGFLYLQGVRATLCCRPESTQISVVVAHGLSCSAACGIFWIRKTHVLCTVHCATWEVLVCNFLWCKNFKGVSIRVYFSFTLILIFYYVLRPFIDINSFNMVNIQFFSPLLCYFPTCSFISVLRQSHFSHIYCGNAYIANSVIKNISLKLIDKLWIKTSNLNCHLSFSF